MCITQNYVSVVTMPYVLKFFGKRNENLVSGCRPEVRKNILDRFVTALKENCKGDIQIQKVVEKFLCNQQINAKFGVNDVCQKQQSNKRNGLAELFCVTENGIQGEQCKKQKMSFSFNFG
eukprot:TRINITY_DN5350_c0_g1_i5.p2 TRINITY_DN5350_c0_g1~~TRINITY_DN5350_c0_g1_i5.p2  ORF type:complete len:120 (-),score=8.34 TRINITY_DN5350_c0_g1_i5:265-624(-)